MSDRALPIERHMFRKEDKLRFDTNVWVFIDGSLYRSADKRARLYSDAYKRILEIRCRTFIDAIILSEFVNGLSLMGYHGLPSERPQAFKTFRRSAPLPRAFPMPATEL